MISFRLACNHTSHLPDLTHSLLVYDLRRFPTLLAMYYCNVNILVFTTVLKMKRKRNDLFIDNSRGRRATWGVGLILM